MKPRKTHKPKSLYPISPQDAHQVLVLGRLYSPDYTEHRSKTTITYKFTADGVTYHLYERPRTATKSDWFVMTREPHFISIRDRHNNQIIRTLSLS